ncbi:1-acyl-sn-glycerol-3-phosphate acyltransferase [bacterium]|nr:1-acyl-sn-glycerol-3-phosphate acyltransferase [bacterium]
MKSNINKNKKEKKKRLRKPSFFIYYILGPLVILWIKTMVKIKMRNKLKIEGPSLIISPHRSYYDFLIVPMLIYPVRSHIVATTYWYRNNFLKFLLNITGTIPKNQYRNDVRSIIRIADYLKLGRNVMMFPEGQMSTYGKPLILPSGLDKLIKKYKPNVYFINPQGTYLFSPKWNPTPGKGVVDASINLLIDKNDIDNLNLDTINKILNKAFDSNDDLSIMREHPEYKYMRKNKARGLEKVLMKCPDCGEILPFETNKLNLTCKSCGLSLTFEKDSYRFKENNPKYKDLKDLFDIDRTSFENEIDNGLILEDEATFSYFESLKEEPLFSGKVIMDREKISFLCPEDESKNICIYNNKVINYTITLGRDFEVPTPDKTYRVYPKDGYRSIFYWNYIAILKNKER